MPHGEESLDSLSFSMMSLPSRQCIPHLWYVKSSGITQVTVTWCLIEDPSSMPSSLAFASLFSASFIRIVVFLFPVV